MKIIPLDIKSHDLKVYNVDHEYAGEIDFWGIPEANKEELEALSTILNAKRTPLPKITQAYLKKYQELGGKLK